MSINILDQYFSVIQLVSVHSRVKNHNKSNSSQHKNKLIFLVPSSWRLQVDTDGNNEEESSKTGQLRHSDLFQHTSSETITVIPVLHYILQQYHTSLKSIKETVQRALLENQIGQLFWSNK